MGWAAEGCFWKVDFRGFFGVWEGGRRGGEVEVGDGMRFESAVVAWKRRRSDFGCEAKRVAMTGSNTQYEVSTTAKATCSTIRRGSKTRIQTQQLWTNNTSDCDSGST